MCIFIESFSFIYLLEIEYFSISMFRHFEINCLSIYDDRNFMELKIF